MYRKILFISMIVAVCGLIFLIINRFLYTFPDFAVRITGIIILIDIVVLSFSMAKLYFKKK